MSFLDRLKAGMAAFRGEQSLALPAEGRSSEETISGFLTAYLSQWGSISPVIDFQVLATLKKFWLYNPDISQYVANIVNLGNPGHQLAIEAASDAVAEAAVGRLNDAASRIYSQGCGVDGLLNQYLTSIAWSGAVSSEDVINLTARRVEKVVMVPVEQIRFRYNADIDGYEAYQRATNFFTQTQGVDRTLGLIKLNPETYKYFALSTVENSPYAKPPASAAIDPIVKGQMPLLDSMQTVAKKYGAFGMLTAAVTPPPRKPNESESEYQTRAKEYLAAYVTAFEKNIGNGIVVGYKDAKLEHTATLGGGKDFYDVHRVSEEQVMSAIAQPPVFFGRTDSSTETFADVVYHILLAQVANMQRLAKRRQEATYMLDLLLGGVPVDGVTVSFNSPPSRAAVAETTAEASRVTTAIEKAKVGMISADEAAQEMGYSSWFDPTLLAAGITLTGSTRQARVRDSRVINLSFHEGRYRYQPDVIELASGEEMEGGNIVPFIKKKTLHAVSN